MLDHANGLATIANRGMYNKAHFVLSVEKKDSETGKWRLVGGEDLDPRQTIRPEVADDVNDVLQEIPRNNGDSLDGRPATGKTGTWELNEKSADNAHAWMIGATPQLATAIWVGNVGKQVALIDDNGERVQGSGLPAEIWKRFMDKALAGKDVEQFPEGKGIGNPDAGNGKSPAPTAPPCAPTDLALPVPQPGQRQRRRERQPGQRQPRRRQQRRQHAVRRYRGHCPTRTADRPVDRSSTTRRPRQTVWAPLPYVAAGVRASDPCAKMTDRGPQPDASTTSTRSTIPPGPIASCAGCPRRSAGRSATTRSSGPRGRAGSGPRRGSFWRSPA